MKGKSLINGNEKERILKLHIQEGYNTLLEATTNVPFKNNEEGNKFREFVNKEYPEIAKKLQLDPTGSYNNTYMVRAWNYPIEGKTLGGLFVTSPFTFNFLSNSKKTDSLSKPITKTQVPFKNTEEGNMFRSWVREKHPQIAKSLNLDATGAFNNQTMYNAWNYNLQGKALGQVYNDSKIIKAGNAVVQKDTPYYSLLRSFFPNYAQVQNPRPLGDRDFTDYQRKLIYYNIQNSIKRVPDYAKKGQGCTEYIDWGQNIKAYFDNPKGSPSDEQAVYGTLTSPNFQLATLLGRFCWKKDSQGNYIVTDVYNFKNPGYSELKGATREQLKGKTVEQLKKEYGLGNYAATRTKAWVDFPEGSGFEVKLTINTNRLFPETTSYSYVSRETGPKY